MSPIDEECVVRGGLALTLRVSRVCGLAPLRLTRVRDGWRANLQTTPRYYDYFVMFLLHISTATGAALDLLFLDPVDSLTTPIILTLKFIEVILLVLTVSIGVIESPSRIKQMLEHLNVTEKIQKTIRRDCSPSGKDKKMYIAAILLILAAVATNVTEFSIIVLQRLDSLQNCLGGVIMTMRLCTFIQMFFSFLLEMQFVFLALHVNSTLKSINDSISKLIGNLEKQVMPLMRKEYENIELLSAKTTHSLTEPDNTKYSKIGEYQTTKMSLQTVQRLSLSFGKICDVFRAIDNFYGKLLIVIITTNFVSLLLRGYFVVLVLISSTLDKARFIIMFNFFCHIAYSVIIAEPGHRILGELDRTRFLVSKLFRQVSSSRDPLMTQLDYFYKQILVNKDISYSPMGLFTMTRSLVLTILGSITTYLIILFQYDTLAK